VINRTDTGEEFFLWCRDQDERYELVDGFPVPLRGMSGASLTHDAIAANIVIALGNQLRGSGCRPTTPDAGLRTSIKWVRRPDVTIECAPPSSGAYETRNPIAVFEILSPTKRKRKIDRSEKLQEYMRHPSLRTIVHIDPDLMDVLVYTRATDGRWETKHFETADGVVRVPDMPVAVPLSAIHEVCPWPRRHCGIAISFKAGCLFGRRPKHQPLPSQRLSPSYAIFQPHCCFCAAGGRWLGNVYLEIMSAAIRAANGEIRAWMDCSGSADLSTA
jgi:Uma2 family endonuclease